MRQPPPHNQAQAFTEKIEQASAEYARSGYQHDPRPPTPAPGTFSPAILHGRPVPSRWWIVEDLIPAGNVTMLAGDGGLGKSLLAMQLLTCVTIGKPWLGLGTIQCPSVGVFCEDDRDELHIRQAAINAHYGCEFSDLKSCLWVPRVGEPNVMMHFGNDGSGKATAFYREICETVKGIGARLVLLDSLHDLFSGDENRRGTARQFINELRAMILPVDGAILLLSHPSLSGLTTGTGTAGSTAWHNAVRSRLYLTKLNRKRLDLGQAAEDDDDPNERVLKTMKANYSALGGKIPLRWQDGVFVRPDAQQSSLIDRLEVDRLALEGLRQIIDRGSKVPSDPNASTGFANALRKLPSCKRFSQATLVASQERLVRASKVSKVELGPPSKRTVYLRPADMLYPGEARGAE